MGASAGQRRGQGQRRAGARAGVASRAGDHREVLPGREPQLDPAGAQVVLHVLQPLLGLERELEAPVPIRRRPDLRTRGQQPQRRGALVGLDPEAAGGRLDARLPLAARGELARIPVVHEHADREPDRPASRSQPVLDVGGVLAVLHPDPLLELRVPDRPGPGRDGVLEAERLEMDVPRRIDRPARPLVGAEGNGQAVDLETLGELGEQQRVAERRLEGREQQPVISAGECAGHSPGGEPSDPVRHQPFQPAGDPEVRQPIPSIGEVAHWIPPGL